jgi:hypothetical protein
VLLAQRPTVFEVIGMVLVCAAIVLSGQQRAAGPDRPLPG